MVALLVFQSSMGTRSCAEFAGTEPVASTTEFTRVKGARLDLYCTVTSFNRPHGFHFNMLRY